MIAALWSRVWPVLAGIGAAFVALTYGMRMREARDVARAERDRAKSELRKQREISHASDAARERARTERVSDDPYRRD